LSKSYHEVVFSDYKSVHRIGMATVGTRTVGIRTVIASDRHPNNLNPNPKLYP